jgi:hypothetical protein
MFILCHFYFLRIYYLLYLSATVLIKKRKFLFLGAVVFLAFFLSMVS